MKETKRNITAFSFWEFLQLTQAAILDGYRFSDSVEDFPTAFVANYSCKMVLVEKDEKPTEAPTDAPTDPAPKQVSQNTRGRKTTK